ncbi:LppP/LprE family lipoprotein [Corynebacterium aurimucosum]|uniref:LppP/LprE family lipoprotein n=1 Tax=Corynebacterium aurimucosum TaxID=169292 RepID=UPI000C7FD2C8|nr:LppP/LprE family lipoprotein [Corynebacterium aurimucosum]PMC72126.1 LppP/LprE family lipoprotein [Corynebacterium aurimucosum]
MLRSAVALLGAAVICFPLASCSQDDGAQDTADSPMFNSVQNSAADTPPVSVETTEASESPAAGASPTLPAESPTDEAESCQDIDAHAAYESGIGTIPPWNDNNWTLVDFSQFDPCAELSWQTISIERGTSSSPYHIMLFHKGEYLGTATAEPYGFFPTVEQVSSNEIAVTYHWPREGESNAGHTGETHAGFRWDDGQQKVIMSGDVPPGS